MRDFTAEAYGALLESLLKAGYRLLPVKDSVELLRSKDMGPWTALRHDVDRLPRRSQAAAEMEHRFGIRSTYYFRVVSKAWDEAVIRAVADMGHEVGYHYEDLALCGGDLEAARDSFLLNIEALRRIAPVATACMHGSPVCRWDNRDIWKALTFEEAGISAEPYLTFNGTGVAYFTDTGRRWDAVEFNVRDQIAGAPPSRFESTSDMLLAVAAGLFPFRSLLTTHPQRWVSEIAPWTFELVAQSIKNPLKRLRRLWI